MPTPRLALLLLALAWLPIGSLAAQTDEPTTSDQPVASEPAGEANSAADASQPSSEQESPTSESSSEAVGTAKEVEAMNVEVDALIAAKTLKLEQLESLGRVILKGDVTKMSTAELKRDMLVYARNYPAEFLEALEDPALKLHSTIQQFFDERMLAYRNKNKDVYFNLPSNKKRLLTIPML